MAKLSVLRFSDKNLRQPCTRACTLWTLSHIWCQEAGVILRKKTGPHSWRKTSLWPRLLSDHLLRTPLYYVCLGGCAECLIKYEYFFQIGWCLMCIYCMNTYRPLLLFISLQCEKLFSNAQEVTVSLLTRTGKQDTGRERQTANTMWRQGKLDFLKAIQAIEVFKRN